MKKIILFFSVCMLFMLMACSKEAISDDSPVTENEILNFNSQVNYYLEPFNNQIVAQMHCIDLNGVNYAFEDGIDDTYKNDCIEKTQSILKRISPDLNLFSGIGVNIFSNESYSSTYINNRSLCTSIRDFSSREYIIDLLLTVYGEYCNYGLAYGYAEYLFDDINGFKENDNAFSWNKNNRLQVLDLNYLCFNKDFVSESELESVKEVSVSFVFDYISKKGEDRFKEIFSLSGDIDKVGTFVKELSSYYLSNGITYLPGTVLYSFGGKFFDYSVKSLYAVMYVDKDFQDAFVSSNPLIYEGFLHKNYSDTKSFFEKNIEQMGLYRELFGFNEYDNSTEVFFTNNLGHSCYIPVENYIVLDNVVPLSHEYVHSITSSKVSNQSLWNTEGLADYYYSKYNYYAYEFWNLDYNSEQSINSAPFLKEFLGSIHRDFDSQIDFHEFSYFVTHYKNTYNPNSSYTAGACFVAYLIDRFGEKEALNMIFSENGITGETYITLVAEWKQYILDNYSEYSVEKKNTVIPQKKSK